LAAYLDGLNASSQRFNLIDEAALLKPVLSISSPDIFTITSCSTRPFGRTIAPLYEQAIFVQACSPGRSDHLATGQYALNG